MQALFAVLIPMVFTIIAGFPVIVLKAISAGTYLLIGAIILAVIAIFYVIVIIVQKRRK